MVRKDSHNIAIKKTFPLCLSLHSQGLTISQYSSVRQPYGQLHVYSNKGRVRLLGKAKGIELV